MKKKGKKINKVLILVVLSILVISMGIFSFLNKNKAEIAEVKTFSEIPGFSFNYIIFKNWGVREVKKIEDNEYNIFFSYPNNINLYQYPQLNIKKEKIGSIIQSKGNPQGINDFYDNKTLIFYNNKNFIKINLVAGGIEKEGFSEKILLNKIIETFKFK